jgi:hypothetical protein
MTLKNLNSHTINPKYPIQSMIMKLPNLKEIHKEIEAKT